MTIAIDFDGTCVTHEYPKIGKSLGAEATLKTLVENGHKLILLTMRSGKELDEAVEWFKTNDISLYGINNNPTQKNWTQSPKVFANLYIDDAALGAPLLQLHNWRGIDWKPVILDLEKRGCLLPEDLVRCAKDIIQAQSNLALYE